jgi:two-component system cell cycle sensor histidine kinase/response regulator CckA
LATFNLLPGSYIVVQVRDNGCGMDAATKAKIFDPFFTTKFTGRGLGLAAVAGIARSQGGAVAVDSVVGEGTTFAVYLPVSLRVLSPVRAHLAPLRNTGAATVLVVDDDTMVRRVTQLSLEDAGFHVILASGGQEALQTLLSDYEAPISLVVLDLRMPGMSGKQVLQHMKVLGIDVPVLLSSGYNEREVRDEFTGIEFAGFIQKPFTPRQLGNFVTRLLYPQQQ